MKTKTKQRIWFVILLIGLLAFFATGCGTKKSLSESERKEDTNIDLTDNSEIVSKIEHEQQLVDTNIKERIITLYGVRMVPYPIGGDTIYIPMSYPEKKEEERDISVQEIRDILNRTDSIRNAVELSYQRKHDEYNKRVDEMKETRTLYHIALIVLGIGLILMFVFR